MSDVLYVHENGKLGPLFIAMDPERPHLVRHQVTRHDGSEWEVTVYPNGLKTSMLLHRGMGIYRA